MYTIEQLEAIQQFEAELEVLRKEKCKPKVCLACGSGRNV